MPPALLDLDSEIEGAGSYVNSPDAQSNTSGMMQVNPIGQMTQSEIEQRRRMISEQIEVLQGASGMLNVDARQLVSSHSGALRSRTSC